MSTRTERSVWSNLEEVDSLENVDKQIQLVSTSTGSNSISQYSNENGRIHDSVKLVPENKPKNPVSSLKRDHSVNNIKTSNGHKKLHLKLYSSFDDLRVWTDDRGTCPRPVQQNKNPDLSDVAWLDPKKTAKKITNQKYGHVQSKIKQYFDTKYEVPEKNLKTSLTSDVKADKKKEEYLEEINKHLTKELEEKNAILSLLQENYERLLFKYAEAQNRIDELRFKCVTTNLDSRNSGNPIKCNNNNNNNNNNNADIKYHRNEDHTSKKPEMKCPRTGCPDDPPYHSPNQNKIQPPARPLSLPLDTNIKLVDRDAIMTKATTPTDSEGLSSIITSMSGHSKILNSLDEENQINKKTNSYNCSTGNFILEPNSNVNDPFDKVKNWQNSLPPLEQIETPETALYSVFPNSSADYSSGETKYNEIASPKIDNDYVYLDESCPPSWRDENVPSRKNAKCNSHRTVPSSGTLTQRNSLDSGQNKKGYHSADVDDGGNDLFQGSRASDGSVQRFKNVSFKRKGRRRGRHPPLLRCSSLPTYDQETVKSGIRKNGIYIPPLDLGNVTLSDDESYCQQEFYVSKSNGSSCVTSRGGSNERYIQTSESLSSCKNTISEDNYLSGGGRQTTDKSTSITPERSKAPDLFFATPKNNCSKGDVQKFVKPQSSWICPTDRSWEKSQNWCNICGECLPENYSSVQNRSNSCESVHGNDFERKESCARNRVRLPFKRSVSFGSETITPKYCEHEERFHLIPSQESLDNFEVYANNLKARSQVALKALTAHMNNS